MVQSSSSSSRDNSHRPPFAPTCSLFHFLFLYIISIVSRILYTSVCGRMFLDIWNLTNGYVYVTRSRGRLPVVKIHKSTQPTNDLVKINPPRRPLVFTPRPTLYHTPYSIPNVVSDRACNETLCSTGCQARCAGK